jgi:large subunit ribosomal protein L30
VRCEREWEGREFTRAATDEMNEGALALRVKMTAKKTDSGSGKIQLKWVRSAICAPTKQKLVIKGLGFTRLNQVIERPNTAAIRGMVAKVPHLVEIV